MTVFYHCLLENELPATTVFERINLSYCDSLIPVFIIYAVGEILVFTEECSVVFFFSLSLQW